MLTAHEELSKRAGQDWILVDSKSARGGRQTHLLQIDVAKPRALAHAVNLVSFPHGLLDRPLSLVEQHPDELDLRPTERRALVQLHQRAQLLTAVEMWRVGAEEEIKELGGRVADRELEEHLSTEGGPNARDRR